MTLAEYLASPQAREHAKDMIAHKQDAAFPIDGGWQDWQRAQIGAWTRLSTGGVYAYFRPAGERFIVTDLGEGVRAQRLRTGCQAWRAHEAMLHLRRDGEITPASGWLGGMDNAAELDGVKSHDLPNAICRVMLASHKVATMGAE